MVLQAVDNTRLSSKLLSKELSGTYKERLDEEKTIFIKYHRGARPEVIFTGFWGGHDIKATIKAIPRAYRVRRREMTRPIVVEQKPLEVKGGGGSDVSKLT